jgi:hypothetical protein
MVSSAILRCSPFVQKISEIFARRPHEVRRPGTLHTFHFGGFHVVAVVVRFGAAALSRMRKSFTM